TRVVTVVSSDDVAETAGSRRQAYGMLPGDLVSHPFADELGKYFGELVVDDLLDLQLQQVVLEVLIETVGAILGLELGNPLAGVQQVLQPSAPSDLREVGNARRSGTDLIVCGHLALQGRLVPSPALMRGRGT